MQELSVVSALIFENWQKHNKMELFIPNDKVINTVDNWNCILFVDCIIVRKKACTAVFVD